MLTRAGLLAARKGGVKKRKKYVNTIPRSIIPRAPPAPIRKKGGSLYEIEAVLKKRDGPRGAEYLVKWKGYSLSDASWISGPLPSYYRNSFKGVVDLVTSDSSDEESEDESEADEQVFKDKNKSKYESESEDSEISYESDSDSEISYESDSDSDSEDTSIYVAAPMVHAVALPPVLPEQRYAIDFNLPEGVAALKLHIEVSV